MHNRLFSTCDNSYIYNSLPGAGCSPTGFQSQGKDNIATGKYATLCKQFKKSRNSASGPSMAAFRK